MSFVLLQLAAALCALGYLRLAARDRPELLRAFARALPWGAISAYSLGFLYRVAGRTGDGDLIGAAAFGALGGVALSIAWQTRQKGGHVAEALDRVAPALALLLAIGRVGCFVAGCDAGRISDVAWAVRFSAPSSTFRDHVARGLVLPSDHASLAVHPAQLYETAIALVIAAVVHRWRGRQGSAMAFAALLYGVGRTAIESLRAGPDTPMAIATSLSVVLASAAWLSLSPSPGAVRDA